MKTSISQIARALFLAVVLAGVYAPSAQAGVWSTLMQSSAQPERTQRVPAAVAAVRG